MDVVVPGQGQTASGAWNRESHFPQTLPPLGAGLWEGFCGWFWDNSVDSFLYSSVDSFLCSSVDSSVGILSIVLWLAL